MSTYLVVGHFSLDRLAGGERVGGTVLYAARRAAAMGYDTRIVTSTSPACARLAERELSGVAIHNEVCDEATTFEYAWDAGGRRVQTLTALAGFLGPSAIPDEWLSSDVCHLGPIAGEIDQTLAGSFAQDSFVGITPQGWMREVRPGSIVGRRAWHPEADLLQRANAVVFSREDVAGAHDLARSWSMQGPNVVVTAAQDGADLFVGGRHTHIPATPVDAVNDLGPGDVFAATYFARRWEGMAPVEAAENAGAAAAASAAA